MDKPHRNVPPAGGWLVLLAHAAAALQTSAAFVDLEERQTHDILAVRVYTLNWALDGILRMRGTLLRTPPVAEREATYRRALEAVQTLGPAEWRQQIASLCRDPERDGLGVWTLVCLLMGLELLNADCRRRFADRPIRKIVEAWRRGEGNAEKIFYTLTRKRKVYDKRLEAWFAPAIDPTPPARQDTKSAEAAAWAEHDGLCLEALRDVVTAYEAAVADVKTGDVIIPALPDGPFAALYPVRKPWWKPIATRLCAEYIQASLAEFYAKTDDSIEKYPLKAFDLLEKHHNEYEAGRLPLTSALLLGAKLRTGRKKGVPYRVASATTPQPDSPPPVAPPGYLGADQGLRYREVGTAHVGCVVPQDRGSADLVGDSRHQGRDFQGGHARPAQDTQKMVARGTETHTEKYLTITIDK